MVSILFPNGGCPPLRPSHDDQMEANPLPSRRQIVKRFVLGAVGWWAAGSWRSQELLGAVLPTTGTLVLPLSAFPALAADGGSIRLYAGLDQTLIINRSGNTFYALGSRCSHAGCPVGTYVATNGSMRCPCHGSEYFIDGTVKQGPAPDPLDSFPTVFHGGSEVRVTVPNVTFGARVIQVMSESGGTCRFKLSFHATPVSRLPDRISRFPGRRGSNHPILRYARRSSHPNDLPQHHPRAHSATHGSLR